VHHVLGHTIGFLFIPVAGLVDGELWLKTGDGKATTSATQLDC
jgi:hypothetical protein